MFQVCVSLGHGHRSGRVHLRLLQIPKLSRHDGQVFHIWSIFGQKVEIYKNRFSIFRKIDEISAEDEIREAFKVFDSVSRDPTPWIAAKNVILQISFRMEMASSTVKSWAMWWTIWDYKWTRMKLRWLSDEKWQIPMIFLCRVLNVSVVIYLKRVLFQGLIDEIDIDGDGQINYEEFYNMMSSKWPKESRSSIVILNIRSISILHFKDWKVDKLQFRKIINFWETEIVF